MQCYGIHGTRVLAGCWHDARMLAWCQGVGIVTPTSDICRHGVSCWHGVSCRYGVSCRHGVSWTDGLGADTVNVCVGF